MQFSSQTLHQLANNTSWYYVKNYNTEEEVIYTGDKPWFLTRLWYLWTDYQNSNLSKVSRAMKRFIESASESVDELTEEDLENLETLKGRIIHLESKSQEVGKKRESSFISKFTPASYTNKFTNTQFNLVNTAIDTIVSVLKKQNVEADPITQNIIDSLETSITTLQQLSQEFTLELRSASSWSESYQTRLAFLKDNKIQIAHQLEQLKTLTSPQGTSYKNLFKRFQPIITQLQSCNSFRIQQKRILSSYTTAIINSLYSTLLNNPPDYKVKIQQMRNIVTSYEATLETDFDLSKEERSTKIDPLLMLIDKAEKKQINKH